MSRLAYAAAGDSAVAALTGAAADMFQIIPPGSGRFTPLVPALLAILAAGDRTDQQRALQALTVFGPDSAPAVPTLIELLETPLRESAVEALGAIGPAAAPALPRLLELLRDDSGFADDVRLSIPWTLGRIGDPAAIPALIEAAGDPDDLGPGWRAIDALGMLGAAARPAAPFLLGLLDDPRFAELSGNILSALVEIGPADGPVWAALLRAMAADDSPEARADYAQSLYRLVLAAESPPPDARQVFARLAADPDEAVRAWADVALRALRDHHPGAA